MSDIIRDLGDNLYLKQGTIEDVERGLKPDESLEDELDVQIIDKNGEIPDETSRKIDMLLDSVDE